MSAAVKVDETARIEKGAALGRGAEVGPYAVIHRGAEIGENVRIGAHCVIWGGTVIGANTQVHSHCSLGADPQDKKYHGETARLVIGENNVIREFCFFNRGTAASGETRIGDDNWLMAYVHIAHDCVVGNGVTVANAAQIAGHAEIGDGVVLSGGVLVHQFSRIGRGAMVGGGEKVRMDIPPFALYAEGKVGVNAEGMRRAGFSPEAIAEVKSAFRRLYRAGLTLEEAREQIRDSANALAEQGGERGENGWEAVKNLADFLSVDGRGIIRPSRRS